MWFLNSSPPAWWAFLSHVAGCCTGEYVSAEHLQREGSVLTCQSFAPFEPSTLACIPFPPKLALHLRILCMDTNLSVKDLPWQRKQHKIGCEQLSDTFATLQSCKGPTKLQKSDKGLMTKAIRAIDLASASISPACTSFQTHWGHTAVHWEGGSRK